MENSNTWGSVTLFLNRLGWRSLLLPSNAWSQDSLRDWFQSTWSSYSMSQILALRLPQFLHAPTQNSKDLEKSTNSQCWRQKKICKGTKRLKWGGTGYDHHVLPFHIKIILFVTDVSFSTGNLRLLLKIVESELCERSVCLNQLCLTQMACWAKNYVTILTRAARWMTYL